MKPRGGLRRRASMHVSMALLVPCVLLALVLASFTAHFCAPACIWCHEAELWGRRVGS